MIVQTDLEQVDPRGRFDVLVYRGLQGLLEKVEVDHGLQGIWDNARPLVNEVVSKHVSGIEIPMELKVLLGIVQANWNRGEKK